MDFTPQQMQDDLRGLFRGDLFFDAPRRALYSTDASVFQIVPFGIAVPRDEADLRALVTYAHENSIPLVPRGAGTGLAGESLGPGLVVDLSVHFRSIVSVESDRVKAQVGVTHAELNAALAPQGRRFAPNPANSETLTLGGMIATNASGSNVFRHGYVRDHVRALRVVWDNGEADEICEESLGGERPDRTIAIRSQTAALIAESRDLILLTRPHTHFNRCGYLLHDVLTPSGLNLAKLLTGSEGTLAFMTEATVATTPLPGGTCCAVLGFETMDAAVRAGLTLRSVDGIVACDLLDQRLLAAARMDKPDHPLGSIPAEIGAALLLTWEAESPERAERYGMEGLAAVPHFWRELLAPTAVPEECASVESLRLRAVGGLSALVGARPIPCGEDVAVPVEELPKFLASARAILKRFDLSASIHLHLLAGIVHIRPILDLYGPDDRTRMWPIADALHTLAISVNGTVGAQHGTGLARTPWMEKQYGPLMPVFQRLKRIFDPRQILNPGKIIGPDPSRPAWPLRTEFRAEEGTARKPLLLWKEASVVNVTSSCNGCGDCRTRATTRRMCPVFHALDTEEATPRAKAGILHRVFDPAGEPLALSSQEVRTVADLCVNCKMCREECQSKVDIPKLMLEAKAAHFAEHGLEFRDWVAARGEALSVLAGTFAFTANLLLVSWPTRWLIELFFGVSRKRALPRFTHLTFIRRAWRFGWTRRIRSVKGEPSGVELPPEDRKKIAYFVDTFANYNDPQVGLAVAAVLRHNGYQVHVPRRQRASGMAPLAQGDTETARENAAYNVRILADLVREGYVVICSDPTAALALTQDYLDLLDTPDARLVAANTLEFTTFLLHAANRGHLRTDFVPLETKVGHHVPCHVKALHGPIAGPELLRLIPGLQVEIIDRSCSGMAGYWGLMAAHREASLRAGQPMLEALNEESIRHGSTECGMCRLQMQEGTGKRTLHPAQYLALAYGLMPELRERLRKKPGKRLTE